MKNMRLSNEEYIERCYNVIMNRKSDVGGKAYWLSKLASGTSKKQILKDFVNSNEFSKLARDYNITKGIIK